MNPDVHSSHVGKVNSIRSAFLSFPMALCWHGRSNRHNSRVTSELNWMGTAGGLLNGMKQGMRSFAFDYPTIHPSTSCSQKWNDFLVQSALHLVLLLLLLPPADLSFHWILFRRNERRSSFISPFVFCSKFVRPGLLFYLVSATIDLFKSRPTELTN